MLSTAGGALWPPLSRRTAVCVVVALVVWWAPLPPGALESLGRALLALVVGVLSARVLAPLLPRPTLPGLNRRAVLVTGSNSGFGFVTALALDAAGAPVLAAVRDLQGAGAQRLQNLASWRLRLIKMDVCDDASIAAAVPVVKEALGNNVLWAIVNNAGGVAAGESEWFDIQKAKDIIDLNTFGTLRVTRAFLPLLRESRGRVVNMISILCRVSLSGAVPYCMSKFATLALTEAMRLEVSRFGISVHSIEPWFYKTPLVDNTETAMRAAWDKCSEEVREAYGERYIERLKKSSDAFLGIVTFSASKIEIVADSIVDACFSRDPKMRYVPSFIAEAVVFLTANVPYFNALLHYISLPRIRKTATNTKIN